MSVTFIPNEATKRLMVVKAGMGKKHRVRVKFQAFRDLGPERYLEIENMLLSGESPTNVAVFIRKEWNVFSEVKENTTVQLLKKFKKEVIAPKLSQANGIMRSDKSKALSKTQSNINIACELEDLCQLQKNRITKMMAREEKMPMIFTWMQREIRLLKDIFRDYAMFKMSTGMLGKMKDGSPLMQVNIVQGVADFNLEVERGAQIASATTKMMQVLAGPVIDVTE